MNTLALFNLAPGFLAGHSARMAKELESAATDFAASFKTLADLGLKPELDPATAAEYRPRHWPISTLCSTTRPPARQ